MVAKFRGNILSLTENIAKSFFGEGYFLTQTVNEKNNHFLEEI